MKSLDDKTPEKKDSKLEEKINKLIEMGIPKETMFKGVPLVTFLATYCYSEMEKLSDQAYPGRIDEGLRRSVFERTVPLFFSERDIQQKFQHEPKFRTWYEDEGEQFLYSHITPQIAQKILQAYTRYDPDCRSYHERFQIPGEMHYLFNKTPLLQEKFSEELFSITLDFLSGKYGNNYLHINRFLSTQFAKDKISEEFLVEALECFKEYDFKKRDLLRVVGPAMYETDWGKAHISTVGQLKEFSLQPSLVNLAENLDSQLNVSTSEVFEEDLAPFITNNHSKKYLNEERFQKIVHFVGKNSQYAEGVFGRASTSLLNSCVKNEEDYDHVIKYFEKTIKDHYRNLMAVADFQIIEKSLSMNNLLSYSLHKSKGNIIKIAESVSHMNSFGLKNHQDLFEGLIIPSEMPLEELQLFLKKGRNNKTLLENRMELFLDPSNPLDIKNMQRLQTALQTIPFPKDGDGVSPESKKILEVITKILVDTGVAWTERQARNNIVDKLCEIHGSDRLTPDMITDAFIEAYAMSISPKLEHNNEEAKELLEAYIQGLTYPKTQDIFKSYPFNKDQNKLFLKGYFAFEKTKFFKKENLKKWYSPNKKEYQISSLDPKGEVLRSAQYDHHLKMANKYFELLDLSLSESKEDLLERKGELIEIRKKGAGSVDRLSWINDVITQIDAIVDLQKRTLSNKNIPSISIYHELDPTRIAMMGNWVQGSCLSFGNSTNNFYSVFTNALDVNKSVFYIENNEGKIIGRVLCAINNDGDLMRFPLYTKNAPNIDLNRYFNEYITELAKGCGLGFSESDDSKDTIEDLIGNEWYEDDPIVSFEE